jgi:TonB family protein
MNKQFKYLMIVLIVTCTAVSLMADTDSVIRFRLYEGFKEKAAPANVAVSYRLKTAPSVGELSKDFLVKERQALINVYNLRDLKLITRDGLALKKGEKKPRSHEVVLKERKLKVRIRPLAVDGDTFKLEVLETDKGKDSKLDTEIVIPRGKAGSMGFEGSRGRIYFFAFNRLAEPDESGEPEMHVFIYERPPLLRRVNPEYPEKALNNWIKGTVVLDTEIGTDGSVKKVQVIQSAHPLLDQAALDAVKQWKYEPFEVKGGLDVLMFTVNVQFDLIPVPAAQTGRLASGEAPRVIRRVEPKYPVTALKAHLQGSVILEVVNDKSGNVKSVKVINGHPLLRKAAVDAVKQWKYEPYLIDGEAKSVIFNETINFSLRGRK